MGKINKLDFAVANLIAAGEVVDKPSSVLKELLENAIDAGATKISASISRGGIEAIRVADNGCGMSAEDLPVSLLRHATSKISDAEDLETIATLGFRGEALAAISSVANVTIITRRPEDEEGHILTSAPGSAPMISEVGCAVGTTVSVEEIFANVPARRKFLKKDVTEASSCLAVCEKVALSRPDIAFRFISDGNEKFVTSGDGNLKNTAYAVFGKEFASSLIDVNTTTSIGGSLLKVRGYIGNSSNCRANRNMQNFFINGRFVKSRTCQAAIERAFVSYIPENRFPVCLLYIDIPLNSVDVNVHPAKLEVRFSDEKTVFDAVYYAAKNAIATYTVKEELALPRNVYDKDPRGENKLFYGKSSFSPKTSPLTQFTPIRNKGEGPRQQSIFPSREHNEIASYALRSSVPVDKRSNISGNPYIFTVDKEKLHPEEKPIMSAELANKIYPVHDEEDKAVRKEEKVLKKPESDIEIPKESEAKEEKLDNGERVSGIVSTFEKADEREEEKKEYPKIKYRGIVFNKYIIAEQDRSLIIIDKHAAHERVLFEHIKASRSRRDMAPQMLLVPISKVLTAEERDVAVTFRERICEAGFDFTLYGNAVSVTQIPDMLTLDEATDLFMGLLDEVSAEDAAKKRDEVYERALYQASCKAAMKGGRPDCEEKMIWLCEELSKYPEIKVCPHGRPVILELTEKYLDRSFLRLK